MRTITPKLPTQFPKRPSPSPRYQNRRNHTSNKPNPPQPNHEPPPANSAASSAGAPTPPVASSRSLGQMIQAGPLGRLGRSYSRVQERRPYRTQVVSSVIIYLCGDLSAQILFPSEAKGSKEGEEGEGESKTGGYDPWRTVRHLIVGVGSSIPTYNWFMFLHRNFNYTSKPLSILTKVCVQQAVFTPVFNTYFFSLQSLLSGGTLLETYERLKKALPLSIQNSVKLWPAVTAFSFMYVGPQFRSIFSGVIAVGWQTYLSWLNQKAAREVAEAEAREMRKMNEKGLMAAGAGAGAI